MSEVESVVRSIVSGNRKARSDASERTTRLIKLLSKSNEEPDTAGDILDDALETLRGPPPDSNAELD